LDKEEEESTTPRLEMDDEVIEPTIPRSEMGSNNVNNTPKEIGFAHFV
jgi:hypothetical protein